MPSQDSSSEVLNFFDGEPSSSDFSWIMSSSSSPLKNVSDLATFPLLFLPVADLGVLGVFGDLGAAGFLFFEVSGALDAASPLEAV